MHVIVESILAANPNRQQDNLHRRIFKLSEEYGEIIEAYLNVTSSSNGKGKTWADVREEAVDLLIVAVDVALTPIDGRCDIYGEISLRIPVLNDIEDIEDELVRAGELIGEMGSKWREYRHLPSEAKLSTLHEIMIGLVTSAVYLAFLRFPDQSDLSNFEIGVAVRKEVERKLAKWARNRDTGRVATDAE